MIEVDQFVSLIKKSCVDFFCGVPDSLLKNFCAYVTDHCADAHVITANEGGAVGLAAGHYLATGKMACVYMQNSGQGNAVNPLASLADPEVYSIPMLLLIGWRGEPGVHDEPQHVKQGKITVSIMETLGIPVTVLSEEVTVECEQWRKQVSAACELAMREKRPVALIVKKGLFAEYQLQSKQPDVADLRREEVVENILKNLPEEAVVVSTTGMISREVYETRERLMSEVEVDNDGCHSRDFLTVGSMGHASQIALGIAMAQPDRPVFCIDGDGASIMQMGNMAIVGQSGCANLTHIVLNNAAHDSVGGQPTVGGAINLRAIASACGYEIIESSALQLQLSTTTTKPRFCEVLVAKGARKDLGRPKEPPLVNKRLFMKTLGVESK